MWSCVSKTVSVSDSWVLDVMCVGASSLCCLNSNQTRQVTLHDTSTMQVTWSASPHAGIASDVQVFSDQLLVSCGRDGTVALLDSRARQPTALLRVGGAVNSVTAGSSAGNAVIAAASGSCLFVFDPRTLRLAARLEGGHADDEEAVAVRANGPLLASGGTDGVVALWSGESGWSEEESLIEVLNEEVAVSRLDWRGSMLFVSSLQQASLWRDGQLVWTLPDNGAYIPLGPALDRVAFAHRDGGVALMPAPVGPGHQIWLLGGHTAAPCRAIAVTGDSSVLFTGGEDGCVCIWREEQEQNFGGAAPIRSVGSFGFAGSMKK